MKRACVLGALALLCFPLGAEAQTDAKIPAWENAAGASLQFEVASVRPDDGAFQPPSFALSPDASFRDPGGVFHADFTVETYIQFAYKLWLTGAQQKLFEDSLPAWAKTQRYRVQAKAPAAATKDQYRLMMQDLLRTRFGLKVHTEQRELPVLVMTLAKPGVPGPALTPHAKGPACDAEPPGDVWPRQCYLIALRPVDGREEAASRGITMDLLADMLASLGGPDGEIDRSIVNETGLTGEWDLRLPILRAFGALPKAEDVAGGGAALLEAIHDQLGMKLKPERRTVPVLLVDSIQRPSEN